jgi:CheY-like chemotaxis protein
MDCEMPEMDGYEATAAIRALDGYADTPIIALTANVTANARERCEEAGMSDYLSKPLKFETLKEFLKKYVDTIEPN